MTPAAFRKAVWAHYRAHGRHELPWRLTRDPYAILVSEIMLQQTQVDRVIPYFISWMERFPDASALAAAPLAEVLRRWQGLGYNRRAKMLHEAAKAVVREYGGTLPRSPEALQKLPGIGPYTANAVAAFAFNADVAFIETNLRTVAIYHLFPERGDVRDAEILEALARAFPKGKSREWYAALMDYGAHLKRSGVRTNARSKGYVKQTSFKGSGREARGAILKRLAAGSATRAALLKLLSKDRHDQIKTQFEKLLKEGLIAKEGSRFRLPE